MKLNMSPRYVVFLVIFFFNLIISLVAEPKAIQNLKINLSLDYFVNKCYVREDITPFCLSYNLHPNYLKAVNAARELILDGRIYDGRKTLVNATKAMIMERPDLIEFQSLVEHIFKEPGIMCLKNIEKVVNAFVNDVEDENKKRKFDTLE